jgi:hypothetical protein
MSPVRSEFLAICAGFVLGPLVGAIALAIICCRTADRDRRRAQLVWIGIFVIAAVIATTLIELKGAHA